MGTYAQWQSQGQLVSYSYLWTIDKNTLRFYSSHRLSYYIRLGHFLCLFEAEYVSLHLVLHSATHCPRPPLYVAYHKYEAIGPVSVIFLSVHSSRVLLVVNDAWNKLGINAAVRLEILKTTQSDISVFPPDRTRHEPYQHCEYELTTM